MSERKPPHVRPTRYRHLTGVAVIAAAIGFNNSASAAGIDSRTYTCDGLQALIAQKGFVFIGNPDFQDFVVADVSYCSGGGYSGYIQLRSVPTRDNPECLVNYCRGGRGGAGG